MGACVIPLTRGMFALVDPEDWVTLNRHNWRAKKGQGGWYAMKITREHGKTIYHYMHRLVMKTPKDMHCHHRFGNTLDNRKHMLQNITPPEHQDLSRVLRIARVKNGLSNPLS